MIFTVTLNTSIDRLIEVRDFAAGQVTKGVLRRVHPAGKGINVSRTLAALGVSSVATGFVGQEEEALFRDSLDRNLIEVALVPVQQPTRMNVTLRDIEKRQETHVRESGPAIAPEELRRLLDLLDRRVSGGDLVSFSGSLPPGITDADLAEAVRAARSKGARIVVDTQGGTLRAVLHEKLWMIKPNVAELGDLVGHRLSSAQGLAEAARSLLDRVEVVLVSRGEHGLLAATREGTWTAEAPVDQARNTVGPGDACVAGFLAAQQRGESLDGALRLAVACGAANVLADAAGLVDPETVERLRRSAVVKTRADGPAAKT